MVAQVIGIVANILTFIMFGAPLSQIRRIVQEQDSSSIDRRFMVQRRGCARQTSGLEIDVSTCGSVGYILVRFTQTLFAVQNTI